MAADTLAVLLCIATASSPTASASAPPSAAAAAWRPPSTALRQVAWRPPPSPRSATAKSLRKSSLITRS
eukprot:3552470-Rhodomonas_salina.1